MNRSLMSVARQHMKDALISYGTLTGKLRVFPDFIIIGAQKCGTTALFIYLIKHPSVAHVYKKEVNFFNWNFLKGDDWYKGHFPTAMYKGLYQALARRPLLAGEASANYLAHPHAAGRIARTLPDVKLILLLRNPIDRAHSHYHHSVRRGFEDLSFEEALATEDKRLAGQIAGEIGTEHDHNANYSRYAYRAMGEYLEQLRPWMETFPAQQMLVLNSEEFLTDTAAGFRQVTRYLGLPDWAPETFERYHQGRYGAMDPATRAELATHFAPHNARLYAYLGKDFGWR